MYYFQCISLNYEKLAVPSATKLQKYNVFTLSNKTFHTSFLQIIYHSKENLMFYKFD
jgi:hypothetical protein